MINIGNRKTKPDDKTIPDRFKVPAHKITVTMKPIDAS